MKDTEKMTPLELAKWHIQRKVEWGEEIRDIMAGQSYSGGPKYGVGIGGWIKGQRIKTDKILVSQANGKNINQIFSLREIYNLIKKEQEQPTLF